MSELEHILAVLEIAGVVAFSISGAMVAIEKKLDLFGVLFLGVITSLGGGIIRDILLGSLPPVMFGNYRCITVSVLTSGCVFLIAYLTRDYYFKHTQLIESINNTIDAVGLGVFSVSGVRLAMATGFGYNNFLLICIGMITGVGGGLIRDVVVARTPVIFAKHIYAIASIIGCICYLLCMKFGMDERFSTIIGIISIFTIRMLSTIFKWNLPQIS